MWMLTRQCRPKLVRQRKFDVTTTYRWADDSTLANVWRGLAAKDAAAACSEALRKDANEDRQYGVEPTWVSVTLNVREI